MEILIAIVVIGAFLYFQMNHESNDSGFSQNGVSVDYENGKISIKGKEYNVSQVRRVWMDGNYIHFELEDMDCPLKKVRFAQQKIAREFLSRIEMAITKAKNL